MLHKLTVDKQLRVLQLHPRECEILLNPDSLTFFDLKGFGKFNNLVHLVKEMFSV
jgi:hypothetical protein